MKSILKTLLFVLIPFLAFTQEQAGIQVKYKFLKRNGGFLIGEIVEKKADGPYHIKLDNGVIVEMSEYEFLKIRPVQFDHHTGHQRVYSTPDYHWGFSSEFMGVNNGFRNIGTPGISTGLTIAAHRYFSPVLSFGGGLGMYNYDLDNRRLIIPIFVEGRWRVVRQSGTPIISFKVGHGMAAKNYISGLQDKKGGLFLNPFLGYEFGTDRKVSWTFGIGLLLQNAYYSYTNGSTFADEDIYFRRTEFKLGITIH
ncbi:MAG: hypothetical protein ABI761_14335 [Saprospiraceae bacterium]